MIRPGWEDREMTAHDPYIQKHSQGQRAGIWYVVLCDDCEQPHRVSKIHDNEEEAQVSLEKHLRDSASQS